MAKRELIDKVRLLDKLLYMGYMDDEKSEIEDVVNALSVTEHEIVKSYLDKLKADISNMNCYTARFPDWTERHVNMDDVLKLIDNLLPEQGNQNDNI